MDSVNPIKFDIKAEESDFNCFIDAVAEAEGIIKTGYTAPTDKSHFAIYKFIFDKEKCAVVYDLKAKKISITAKADVLERFKTLYLKRDFLKLKRESDTREKSSSNVPSVAVSSKAPVPAQSKSVAAAAPKSLTPKPSAEVAKTSTVNVPIINKSKQGIAPAKQKDIKGDGAYNSERQQAKHKFQAESQPKIQDTFAQPSTPSKPEPNAAPQSKTQPTVSSSKPQASAQQPKTQPIAAPQAKTQPTVSSSKPQASAPQSKPQTASVSAAKSTAQNKVEKKTSRGKSQPLSPVSSAQKDTPLSPVSGQKDKAEAVTAKPPMEYKDGYAIKKYSLKRLEEALKAVKALTGTSYKAEPATAVGRQDETLTYVISGMEGQKVTLRYMPKKLILQLQGKRSNLFSEVQVLISKDTDFKSAVSSHIELTGESTSVGNMQRRLKKILPHAFDYLDEQSKIDLTIGLIDINNNDTRLSDYSSLLTPPYRGLEKFISDLQRAQGIEVKMIGQGYEKDDDGNYRLKSGYRKRIDSIVYNEVMSALYTEYFSRRNFYSHSDNTDSNAPRIITDKQEVKNIFNHLIEVINYNSKKLKEIGFSVR